MMMRFVEAVVLTVHGEGLAAPFSNPGFPSTCVVVLPPPDAVTVSPITAECVTPPPVAVTVTLVVPVVAVELTVKVKVELPLPGAAMDTGLKLAVTPDGKPDAEREIAALNPLLTVVEIVLLPELPCVTDTLAGEAVNAKSGVAAEVMVKAIVVVWVTPPPVAVSVTLLVPVAAIALAVKVKVELPLPGAAMEAGLKLAVTPEGRPEADRETAALNPPITAVVIALVPELPCTMDRLAGEALTLKSGTTTVRATVAVCVTPPPEAVTVMFVVPAVAVLLAVKVSVELPLPGAAREVELKLAVTPAGKPETDSEIAELNPPLTVVETVVLPELPWFMERLAGEALTLKSAVAFCQTSEIGVAEAALPTCVRPYRSSSVRRTLKWLMVSLNWPCFTMGPTKIVGI